MNVVCVSPLLLVAVLVAGGLAAANGSPASARQPAVVASSSTASNYSGNTAELAATLPKASDNDITFATAATAAPPSRPANLMATAGDASVTLSWDDPSNPSITRYEYQVNHNDTQTGRLTGWGPWTEVSGSGATTVSHTFTGLTNGKEYRYHLRAVNAAGNGAQAPNAAPWYVAATAAAPAVTLTASDVTETTATLTISGTTAAWWHKGSQAGATCTSVAANTSTASLSQLTGDTDYTYKAYSDSACASASELTTAATNAEFSTVGLSAGTPDQNAATLIISNWTAAWWHQKKSGPGSASCTSVAANTDTAGLSSLTAGSSYTWEAFKASGCASADKIANVSFTTTPVALAASDVTETTATLTIDHHTAAWWHQGDQPDAQCTAVAVNTATADVKGLTGSTTYIYKAYSDSGCTTELASAAAFTTLDPAVEEVSITSSVTLTASDITQTTATLTISGHTAAWWYKQTAPSEGTCTSVAASTATVSLSGLTAGTDYTYKAYNASGCASSAEIATESFSNKLTLSTTKLVVPEEGTAAYTVRLGSAPTANVTVTLTRNSTGDTNITFDTNPTTTGNQNTLTFTATDWSTPQEVTVAAADDTDKLYGTAAITHTTASTDSDYSGKTAKLDVVEGDNDVCQGTAAVNNATTGDLVDDCNTLLAAKDTLAGTATLNWATGTAIATWKGITIANDRVTKVDMGLFSGLSGVIPNTLGNLTDLDTLALANGSLTGSIPKELGNLTKLTGLSLAGNYLTGSIPKELGNLTKLDWVALQNNRLTGSIPKELGNLTKLTWLLLYSNYLTGSIPKELGNLTILERLRLGNNLLTGSIPKELGNLINIQRFQLEDNLLTGSIPKELGNLVDNVTTFELYGNNLTGCVPTNLVDFLYDVNPQDNNVSLPACDGIAVNYTRRSVGEGSTATYSVRLSTKPSNTVTVGISITGDTDITADVDTNTTGNQTTLTFTTTTWDTWQTVTLSAAEDVDTLNGTSTITHTATSTDTNYSAATATVTATEDDNTVALAASNVTETTATLTISGTTSAWWYKGDQSGAQCTAVAQNTSTASLTSLTGGTDYTYKAYSNSSCTTELTTSATDAEFSTVGLSAGTPGQNSATLSISNWAAAWWHDKATGPGSATCTSVAANTATSDLSSLTAGSSYTWEAYKASGCNSADKIADVDFATAAVGLAASAVTETTATLTVSGTTAAWYYKGSQAGAQCTAVAANTATASLTGLDGGTDYTYKAYSANTCASATELTTASTDAEFSTVGLSAGTPGQNTATLTISNWDAAWWHDKASGPGSASCTSVAANTATSDLSGLTAGSSYTWEAYDASGCNSTDKIADVNFTTADVGLAASDVTETTATLTISGTTGAWWHKGDQASAQCTAVAANTSTASLTGLDGDTDYTYKAYSASTCASATELTTAATDAEFSTVGLSAGTPGQNTATLTISNWDAGWWHDKASGPGSASCTSVAANTATSDLSGLTAGSSYTWEAYDASGCNSTDKIADVGFTTGPVGLAASDVTETTATLTISGTTSAWWYKGDQSGAQCTSVTQNTSTASLTGLDGGTGYTYKAYSANTCTSASELTTAATDADFSTVGLSAGTPGQNSATLTISNWDAAWWHDKATGPGTASCTSVAANTATSDLTGLTAGSSYTWEAFKASGCASANKIADVDFATPAVGLAASDVAETTATLTISGTTAAWYYKGDQSGAQCTSVAANTSTASLTQLTGGTGYTYKAYSANTCASATELTTSETDADFSTVGLAAGTPGQNSATLSISNWDAAWWHDKATGPGTATCTSVAANTATSDLTGLTAGSSYSWEAYKASGCNSTDKIADVDFTTAPVGLAASDVTETTATLTISGTTSAWYYKGDQAGATCTAVAANTSTASLTGLDGDTDYTYKAYYNSTCTTELTTAATDAEFSTVGLSAGIPGQNTATLTISNWTAAWWHNKTSGPGTASCTAVAADTATADLSGLTAGSSYTWEAYKASGCNSADKIADVDFATAAVGLAASDVAETTATLTISGTTAAWWHKGNQAGATCTSVAQNTSTASLSHLTGDTDYTYKAYSNSTCTTELTTDATDAEFSTVGLSAGTPGQNTATLTISNWDAAWWHDKTSGPGSATCTSVAANTATSDLSSLTAGSSYSWEAYKASGCASADKIANVSFTTAPIGLAASDVTETTATLTISGTTSAWWHQGDQSGAQCTSVAANTSTATLTGLDGDTDYTYKAYSNSTCTTELTTAATDAEFSTVGLTAGTPGQNTATLSISNWTAAWWHDKATGPGSATCTSVAADTATSDLSGLTAGSSYTWEAYKASGCNSTDKIADVDFTTAAVGLAASDVTETTATLTISGTTAAWHYKGNQSGAQCTAVAANTSTASLTGLDGGTDYTYKAYSANTCASATELTTAATDAEFSTVGLSAGTPGQNTATLTISNWAAAWWHDKATGPGTATCTSVAANTATSALSGLTAGSSYSWEAYKASGCASADKIADAGFNTPPVGLAASDVTETTATLTISGTTGAWWYQGDQSGAQCTAVAANTATADLASLTGDTDYTYKAYSANTCASATELTTAATDAEFSTVGLAAGTPGQNTATLTISNWTAAWWHDKATGPGTASCTSVAANTATSDLSGLTAGSSYSWEAYKASGCNSADKIADVDFNTPPVGLAASDVTETTATLTISGTTAAWWYQGGQAGATCTAVAANTSTASLTSLTGGTDYTYKAYSANTCASATELTTAATDAEFSTVGLSAGTPGQNTATLTISNWAAAWWHDKATGPGTASCTSVAANTATSDLTGLTAGSSYTWEAYKASGCNSTDKIADVGFNTPPVGLAASDVTETTATLTISGTAAAWWYQGGQAGATCTAVAANTSTASLTGLDGDTDYTYKAYSDSTCTTELTTAATDAEFSTVGLSAGTPGQNTATLSISNWAAAWWHDKAAGPGTASCTSVAANTATSDLTGLTAGSSYTWEAYKASGCNSADKIADVGFNTPPVGLAASDVTETTATLTISGTAAAWWYQGGQAGATCTAVAANTSTASLTGLDGDTDYTYKAYSANTCASATELTTAATDAEFSTVGLSAGTPGQNTATLSISNWAAAWWHDKAAGPGTASCTSVAANTATSDLTGLTAGSSYTWEAYKASGCASADKIADAGFNTAPIALAASDVTETTATLTISGTTVAWYYKGSQSGATCESVAQGTATADVSGLDGDTFYIYKAYSNSTCTTELTSNATDAEFSTVGLAAGTPGQNTATLTISNWAAAWWHEKTTGPGSATCTSVAANTATSDLSGLTAGSSYTWEAYKASGCNSADKIADVDFATPAVGLAASDVTETTATLTISGHTAAWYYKGSQSGAQCTAVAANTATASLTGLDGDTFYIYKAYSNSTCSSELTTDATDADFSTVGLSAGTPGQNTATLSISNWAAAWWHDKAAGPGTTSCTSVAANTATSDLSGLTAGSSYTWEAYKASGCASADKIADVDFATPAVGLAASDVTETTATLTISGHTAAWYYKGNQSGAQCTAVAANTSTASLTGLDGDTFYIYKAYSNSTCSSELTTDATDADFSTVGLSAGTPGQNSATLSISNWAAAWWHDEATGPGTASCTSVAANTATSDLTGLTAGASYTWEAYKASGCNSTDKIADTGFNTAAVGLAASDVTETTATLTISGHTAAWYYKGDQSGAQCTAVAANTAAADVSGLDGDTDYTYKAYSNSTCSSELTTDATDAEFSTVGLSAGTPGQNTATLSISNWAAAWWHEKTTGPGSATCTSVAANTATSDLTGLTAGSSYTWEAYKASGCASADKIADAGFNTAPAALAASDVTETTATLTISGHTAAWYYKGNQSGAQCTAVAANTSTASLTGLDGDTDYTYKAYSANTCTTASELTSDATDAEFSTVGLAAGTPGQNTATLTISNWTAAWWHDKAAGPGTASCTSVAANTATSDLTGLTAGASYTWEAYKASGCNSTDKIADAGFNTAPAALAASDVTETTATLTISGHTAAWYYKGNQSGAQCTAVAANTSTADVSGLDGDTDYTYKAYSNSTCSSELTTDATDAEFSTVGLSAGTPGQNTATLSISNWAAAWWHDKAAGPGTATCTSVAANTATSDLTGLTAGSSYTWEAYKASGCASADKIADVSFTTAVAAPPVPADPAPFYSGIIDSPDFCTNLSLGGPRTYPYDSDGDGIADVCSLPYTRREAVARQNAAEALAAVYPTLYADLLARACKDLGDTDYGDDTDDLAQDTCATGTSQRYFAPVPPHPEIFYSAVIDGPDFCTNLSLGGPRTYPYDSDRDGDGVGDDGIADVCSLPYTRREAVARQNALDSLAQTHPAQYTILAIQACTDILSIDYGDHPDDLAEDTCATILTDARFVTPADPHPPTTPGPSSPGGGPPAARVVRVTASDITDTGARLTLTGRSGIWYYKQISPKPAGTCTKAKTATVVISGLAPSTAYIYTAYADRNCTKEVTTNLTVTGFAPLELYNSRTFYSGTIDGPDYCTNFGLGGPPTYPYDTDGDGVADNCALPHNR